MSDLLRLTASVELTAAADAANPPRVSILAYTGGAIRVPGWGNVAIDLKGLDISGQVAILSDHNANLPGILGHGSAAIAGGQLLVEGVIPPVTEAAKQTIDLAKSGFRFQASVGVDPVRRERLEPGAKATVNGKKIQADAMGLTLVRAGVLKEVTITALGADANTSVAVAASQKGNNMPPGTIDSDPIIKSERERIATIEAACKGLVFHGQSSKERADEIRSHAMAGEISMEAFHAGLLQVLRNDAELKAMRDGRPKGPSLQSDGGRASGPEMLEAALAIHLGRESVAEKIYGPQACQAARDHRFRHVLDIVRAGLAMIGQPVPSDDREMIRAASGFSTVSLPTLFSNVANKFSIAAYEAVPSVARRVCRIVNANDFKDATGIQLGAAATFDEVGADGEIKHGNLKEATFTYRVDTYAKMFGITRKDLINDDLGALADIPVLLAKGAALKLESLFFTLFLDNAAVFTEDRGNLIDAPLGIEGLKAGYQAMAKMTDANDDPILVRPGFLLTPAELAIGARELVGSPAIVSGAGGPLPVMNGLYGLAEPVDSPYLSNDDYEGSLDTGWYLLADPATVAVAVLGFLQGKQFPTIETEQADFDTLGMRFRGYHDFGVAWADWHGGVKSTGDGA